MGAGNARSLRPCLDDTFHLGKQKGIPAVHRLTRRTSESAAVIRRRSGPAMTHAAQQISESAVAAGSSAGPAVKSIVRRASEVASIAREKAVPLVQSLRQQVSSGASGVQEIAVEEVKTAHEQHVYNESTVDVLCTSGDISVEEMFGSVSVEQQASELQGKNLTLSSCDASDVAGSAEELQVSVDMHPVQEQIARLSEEVMRVDALGGSSCVKDTVNSVCVEKQFLDQGKTSIVPSWDASDAQPVVVRAGVDINLAHEQIGVTEDGLSQDVTQVDVSVVEAFCANGAIRMEETLASGHVEQQVSEREAALAYPFFRGGGLSNELTDCQVVSQEEACAARDTRSKETICDDSCTFVAGSCQVERDIIQIRSTVNDNSAFLFSSLRDTAEDAIDPPMVSKDLALVSSTPRDFGKDAPDPPSIANSQCYLDAVPNAHSIFPEPREVSIDTIARRSPKKRVAPKKAGGRATPQFSVDFTAEEQVRQRSESPPPSPGPTGLTSSLTLAPFEPVSSVFPAQPVWFTRFLPTRSQSQVPRFLPKQSQPQVLIGAEPLAPGAGSPTVRRGTSEPAGRRGVQHRVPAQSKRRSGAALPEDIGQWDTPGTFKVVRPCAVGKFKDVRSRDFAKLSVGATITVVEVALRKQDVRVRGKLVDPKGWISLVSTETGRRWARQILDHAIPSYLEGDPWEGAEDIAEADVADFDARQRAQSFASSYSDVPSEHSNTPQADILGDSANDILGAYRLLQTAFVRTDASADSMVVTELEVDTIVEVLEVSTQQEEQRVVARIARPMGWITIVNMATGVRHASRGAEPVAPPGESLSVADRIHQSVSGIFRAQT